MTWGLAPIWFFIESMGASSWTLVKHVLLACVPRRFALGPDSRAGGLMLVNTCSRILHHRPLSIHNTASHTPLWVSMYARLVAAWGCRRLAVLGFLCRLNLLLGVCYPQALNSLQPQAYGPRAFQCQQQQQEEEQET